MISLYLIKLDIMTLGCRSSNLPSINTKHETTKILKKYMNELTIHFSDQRNKIQEFT